MAYNPGPHESVRLYSQPLYLAVYTALMNDQMASAAQYQVCLRLGEVVRQAYWIKEIQQVMYARELLVKGRVEVATYGGLLAVQPDEVDLAEADGFDKPVTWGDVL